MSFKLNDRLTQGFLAGVAAWVPEALFTLPMYGLFHQVKLRYLDYAAILAWGNQPQDLLQTLFAEFVVMIFLGFLGIVFTMLIKAVFSENFVFKGWLYGAVVWFGIFSVFAFFKIKGIVGVVDFKTAFFNLVGASIWGIAISVNLLYLNRRYGVKS